MAIGPGIFEEKFMPALYILIGIAVAFIFVFVIVGIAGNKRDKKSDYYHEQFLQTNKESVAAIWRRENVLIEILKRLTENKVDNIFNDIKKDEIIKVAEMYQRVLTDRALIREYNTGF
jgi:hypothetical protein